MTRKDSSSALQWTVLAVAIGLAVGLVWPPAASRAADTDEAPAQEEAIDINDLSAMPRQVRKVVYKAAKQSERGEQDRAIKTLSKHLENHPDQDHFQIRLRLARLLEADGQTAAAAEQYAAAAELEPRVAESWYGLAQTAYTLQRYEEAARGFEEGYRVDANRPETALYYAAASYLLGGQPERALPIFEELTGGAHDPPKLDWYRGLVSAALEMEQPELAEPAIQRMLARYADNPESWHLIYQFAASQRDFRRAAVALTVTSYLRPLSQAEAQRLGDLLQAIQVPALATQHYAAAMGDDPGEVEYERLVSAHLAAHEVEEARHFLEIALGTVPSARLWSLMGDVHYLRQDYAAAFQAYLEVALRDEENGRAYLMQGYCALEIGDTDAAKRNLEKAIDYPEHQEIARALLRRVDEFEQKDSS